MQKWFAKKKKAKENYKKCQKLFLKEGKFELQKEKKRFAKKRKGNENYKKEPKMVC